MLVLSRKVGQAIRIGNGVEVRVLETGGKQVRLGITAPPEVPVYRREEVYQHITTNHRKEVYAPTN